MKRTLVPEMIPTRTAAFLLAGTSMAMSTPAAAQVDPTEVVQRALSNASFGYINLSQRGGPNPAPSIRLRNGGMNR